MAADYVFLNAEVITVNPQDDIAQAVAVKGNKVCAVETNEEIRRFAGSETQVIDLQGNSLLPGFIDSHLHMLYGTNQLWVDCKNGVGSEFGEGYIKNYGEVVFEGEGGHATGEQSQLASAAHPAG